MNQEKQPGVEKEVSGPRSLTRLLGLFDALAKLPDGMTLAELNVALESPKSSLLNLLRPLVSEAYLIHDGGRYRLGPAIFRLSANVMSVWNFSKVLRPFMVELAERCGETVYVGILDIEQKVITYIDVIESAQSVRYSMQVGLRRPLYCTAAGRVLLAYAPAEFIEDYLKTVKLERRTPQTMADKKALREEMAAIRSRGISISVGELFPESAGIAAPLLGPDGAVIASLAIGAPSDRFDKKRDELQVLLSEISQRASGSLTPLGSA